MLRQYWRFYWPLSLMGVALLTSRQFQNGVLARYPNAAQQLAVFAYAWCAYSLFAAALIFVPQMSNRLARSAASKRTCLRFTLAISMALTAPVAFMAFSSWGRAGLGAVFGIRGEMLDGVVLYLKLLTPLIVVSGLRHFYSGLLIQLSRTGIVTLFTVVQLSTTVVVLLVGLNRGWSPVLTLCGSQLASAVLCLILLWLCHLAVWQGQDEGDGEPASYHDMIAYFAPVALTSVMFALSRPILYAVLSRQPDSTAIIAALKVAFDLALIFHNPLNQFRSMYVTFGTKHHRELRRFVMLVMAGMTLLMLLMAVTPLAGFIFQRLLGVEAEILAMARQAFVVLCVVPFVVSMRNVVHGRALSDGTTGCMSAGAVSRNLIIYAAATALSGLGWLNPMTAAGILALGFASEAVVAGVWLRRVRRRKRRLT